MARMRHAKAVGERLLPHAKASASLPDSTAKFGRDKQRTNTLALSRRAYTAALPAPLALAPAPELHLLHLAVLRAQPIRFPLPPLALLPQPPQFLPRPLPPFPRLRLLPLPRVPVPSQPAQLLSLPIPFLPQPLAPRASPPALPHGLPSRLRPIRAADSHTRTLPHCLSPCPVVSATLFAPPSCSHVPRSPPSTAPPNAYVPNSPEGLVNCSCVRTSRTQV